MTHIKKFEQWSEKWFQKKEISKEWKECIANYDAQPGKNSTLYKTHKPDIPVRLLTTGCNTAIENVSRFIESICTPLKSNLSNIIKYASHLLDLIDDINKSSLPDKLILVSFDITNMFPNIDNERGMEAVRSLLDSRSSKKFIIMDRLEFCFLNNNSRFANIHLLQTTGTTTGAPNPCSYSDIAISHLDKIINEMRATQFQECFYGRYCDNCLVLWCRDIEKN